MLTVGGVIADLMYWKKYIIIYIINYIIIIIILFNYF